MVFLCIASIVWSSIALHGIALHRIAWHCIAFDYLSWYCMVLHRLPFLTCIVLIRAPACYRVVHLVILFLILFKNHLSSIYFHSTEHTHYPRPQTSLFSSPFRQYFEGLSERCFSHDTECVCSIFAHNCPKNR